MTVAARIRTGATPRQVAILGIVLGAVGLALAVPPLPIQAAAGPVVFGRIEERR